MLFGFCLAAWPQVIEFEAGGLKYQTLTKNGVTVMYSRLAPHIHEYAMLQVAISNGSDGFWSIKPEDFTFSRDDGRSIQAAPAKDVVGMMLEKGSHGDVSKLVSIYETALYGIPHMRVTNGYEQRRQSAMSEGISARFKAAAAASALALIATRLSPGQSTDGAVFFPNEGKQLSTGKLVVHASGETFEFKSE